VVRRTIGEPLEIKKGFTGTKDFLKALGSHPLRSRYFLVVSSQSFLKSLEITTPGSIIVFKDVIDSKDSTLYKENKDK
jgi:hypothetical protein